MMTNFSQRPYGHQDDARVYTCADVLAAMGLISEHGINPDDLLQPLGLDWDLLQDPATRLSYDQQEQVFLAVASRVPPASLPVLIGERLHITSYGLAGFALLSSDTMAAAVGVVMRYAPLFNVRCPLELSTAGEQYRLRFTGDLGQECPPTPEMRLLDVAKILMMLHDIAGEGMQGVHIQCCSEHPEVLMRLLEVGRCPVKGGAATDEIVIPADVFALGLNQANAGIHDLCITACEMMMARFYTQQDVTEEVRKILLSANGWLPTLPEVAERLCMSERTLRRRLQDQDSSFSQIVEDIRRELAIRHVTGWMRVEEIAERLGYSEATNFRHAFKRWTGLSPREYRAGARA